MTLKKTALASAIALALAGGQASAVEAIDMPLCGGEEATGGSGMVCRNTSSVHGRFILDKTTVTEGGRINLAVMALNEDGAVDLKGNQYGSVIMVQVTSQIGKVMVGGNSGANSAPGVFAASVKYVELDQGNGRVWIEYPQGIVTGGQPITDTIEIVLQERFENQRGGITYNPLETASKTVTVNPATPKIKALDITSYEISTEDTVNGWSDGIYDDNESGKIGDTVNDLTDKMMDGDGIVEGVDGGMTAGKAGGQITMVAWKKVPKRPEDLESAEIEQRAHGTATLVLEGSQTYTFQSNMVKGQAIFTIPSEVTKAGTYYIKGTLEGYDGTSVDLYDDDTLTVLPTGTPKKLALGSQKSVVGRALTNGNTGDPIEGTETMVKVTMLDEYGNTLTMNPNDGGNTIKISDDSGVVGAGKLSFPYGASKVWFKMGGDPNTTTNTLGLTSGLEIGVQKLGVSSVVADIENQTAILPSDPLEVTVVEKQLRAFVNDGSNATIAPVGGSPSLLTTFADAPRLAGEEFKGFLVDVWTGAPGSAMSAAAAVATTMTVDHVVKGKVAESLSPTLDTGPGTVGDTVLEVLFNVATDQIDASEYSPKDEYYIISDRDGIYGQVIVPNQGNNKTRDITPAAANRVELVNGHHEPVTSVLSIYNDNTGKYEAMVPERQLYMVDAFGNDISTDNTGTVTMTSANGAVVAQGVDARGTAHDGKMQPTQDDHGAWIASYNASGPNVFVGADTLTLGFTKPGVGTHDLATTVPEKSVLMEIVPNIEQTAIPQNAEVALTLETRDQNGNLFNDPKSVNEGVQITFSGTLSPVVKDNKGNVLLSGSNIKFDEGTGRKVLIVEAGALEGDFTLTFTNADKDISAAKDFIVTSALIENCAAGAEQLCVTEADCTAPEVGGIWDAEAGSCSAAPPSCSATNVELCDDETTCVDLGGNWDNEAMTCSAPAPECSADNLSLCVDETSCTTVGGQWDGASCNAVPEGMISTGLLGLVPVSSLPAVDATKVGTFDYVQFGEDTRPKLKGAFYTAANGAWMRSGTMTQPNEPVIIAGEIMIAPEHVGESVEVLVVGDLRGAGQDNGYYYVVQKPWPFNIYTWDEVSIIGAYNSFDVAPAHISINMYEGALPFPGAHLKVYFGYRVTTAGHADEGTIFFNLYNTVEMDIGG